MVGVTGIFERISFLLQKSLFVFHGHRFSFCGIYAQLLEDIGHNFQDSLRNLNASVYKIKVTSVTRTVDDVKNLKKRNTNSSQNSAHRYGTTFDVSWARYTKVDESDTLNIDKDRLKMVLAMVLRDLKREERCYVKHERKQGCFHITVREKK